MRRLRGGATADEITGGLITYDNTTEVFSVAGAAVRRAPGGRVRAILTPPPAAGSAPRPGSRQVNAPELHAAALGAAREGQPAGGQRAAEALRRAGWS